MAAISFATGMLNKWESGQIYQPIKIIVRDLGLQFSGVLVTSLNRTPDGNAANSGVSNSKHVPENCPSGQCEAVDFVFYKEKITEEIVRGYLKAHYQGISLTYHDVGSGMHYHLEVESHPVRLI